MIKRVLVASLAVGCLVLPGYADKQIALVTLVKGEATRGRQSLRIFANIANGDKLHVAAGASITLMFLGDQHKETIVGDCTFVVAASGSTAPANKKTVLQPERGLIVSGPGEHARTPTWDNGQFSGGVKREGVGSVGPLVTSARHSLSQNPELRWTPVEGAVRYTVSVQGDFGVPPFITQDVTGTSIRLTQPLDRGKTYICKVEAWDADGKESGEDMADVEVLSDVKVIALKAARSEFDSARARSPQDASPYISLAEIYLEAGLPDETIEVFQELAAKNPTSPYPHERLAALYKSLGRAKEAREQEARATELNGK